MTQRFEFFFWIWLKEFVRQLSVIWASDSVSSSVGSWVKKWFVLRHGGGACTVTRPRFWCLQSMSVVDTRLLGRPSTFGGAEAEWPDWAFSMRAFGAAIDAAFLGAMEVASRAAAPVLVTTLGVPEQNVARQLFFMLAMMTKGPALAFVRQAEICGGGPNGLEAWRLLVRRYEPEAATRTLGLLQQILNPVPFPDNVTGFEEALSKWELTISRWESSAHDALNEGVKIALLLKMTPEPLRQNLHLQGHTKYGVARAAVVNALLSQHSWQNASEPMEVGERLVARGLTRVRPRAKEAEAEAAVEIAGQRLQRLPVPQLR